MDEFSGILLRLIQQLFKVFVAILLMVTRLAPFRYCFAVEDENVEESVKKKDVLGLDRSGIKEYRLSDFLVKGAEGGQCKSSTIHAP